MLINVRVNDENQALEFINDVLKDLGLDETKSIYVNHKKIEISPEIRAKHTYEGPSDITIENFMMLNVIIDDLDYNTQEIVNRHKNLLHRL